jgi:hypothetical protein
MPVSGGTQTRVEIGDGVERCVRRRRFDGGGGDVGWGAAGGNGGGRRCLLFRRVEHVDHAGVMQPGEQIIEIRPVGEQLMQLPDRAGPVDQDEQMALAHLQVVTARGQRLAAAVRLHQDARRSKHE